MAHKSESLVVKQALRILDISSVQVDESYQREVKPGHKKIVATFDENALGIPLVAEREDGTLWVVDGLQRLTALKVLGKTKLRAEVFRSMGPEHESKIFALVNGNRTKLDGVELFNARLTAGDPRAWTVKEIVDRHGFKIPRKSRGASTRAPNVIACAKAMYVIVGEMGEAALDFTLDCVKQAWPDDPQAVREVVIMGVAAFYHRRNGNVDKDRLIRNMRTTQPGKLIYSAGLAVGWKGYALADVLERVYRKTGRTPNNKFSAKQAKEARAKQAKEARELQLQIAVAKKD